MDAQQLSRGSQAMAQSIERSLQAVVLCCTTYSEPHNDCLSAVIALQEGSIQCSCWWLDTLWNLLCMYSSLPGKGGGCPSGSFTQPLWNGKGTSLKVQFSHPCCSCSWDQLALISDPSCRVSQHCWSYPWVWSFSCQPCYALLCCAYNIPYDCPTARLTYLTTCRSG